MQHCYRIVCAVVLFCFSACVTPRPMVILAVGPSERNVVRVRLLATGRAAASFFCFENRAVPGDGNCADTAEACLWTREQMQEEAATQRIPFEPGACAQTTTPPFCFLYAERSGDKHLPPLSRCAFSRRICEEACNVAEHMPEVAIITSCQQPVL